MSKERNALKAGIFIVISIALAFSIVVAIRGTVVESTQTRYITFSLEDDLGGLRVGDDVRIGGFKVGGVHDIEIVSSSDPRLSKHHAAAPTTAPGEMLLVTITLPRRYQIREGVKVGVQSAITPQSWINFTHMGQGAVLGEDLPLVGRPNPFSTMMASLSEMGPKLSSIATQVNEQTIPGINGILSDVRTRTLPKVEQTVSGFHVTADATTRFINKLYEQIEPIINRYNQVADSTSGMMGEIRDLVGDTKSDFRGTVRNLNSMTGTINTRLPGLLDKVSGVLTETHTAIGKASVALEDVQKTVANTRDFTGDIKAIVAENRANLSAMTRHLRGTALNLELGSAEIRSRPWRLLYTPKKGEVANLALFDSAREFAKGANELNDAAQALRAMMQNDKADPNEVKRLMDRVQKSFDSFNEVEQKLWNSVKN